MKTINASTFRAFIVSAMFVILIIAAFSSCSAPHWYKATNDGCQSSQGMAGYGNRK